MAQVFPNLKGFLNDILIIKGFKQVRVDHHGHMFLRALSSLRTKLFNMFDYERARFRLGYCKVHCKVNYVIVLLLDASTKNLSFFSKRMKNVLRPAIREPPHPIINFGKVRKRQKSSIYPYMNSLRFTRSQERTPHNRFSSDRNCQRSPHIKFWQETSPLPYSHLIFINICYYIYHARQNAHLKGLRH
jgi:hypothetical protein